MEKVEVRYPSFPEVHPNTLLDHKEETVWQVLCGDKDHWRTGIYSPKEAKLEEVQKLEQHTCPELFMLLEGQLNLVTCSNGKLEVLELEKYKPVLVTTWHNGFCPNGPFTGKALVVERDHFVTKYKPIQDFKA